METQTLAVYERLDQACRWEKQWMHERLGWLFSSQAILFAAYGLALRGPDRTDALVIEFLRILPMLGMLLSGALALAVVAAVRAYFAWTKKLFAYEYPDHATLPFLRQDAHWPRWASTFATLAPPILFFCAWLVLWRAAGMMVEH